MHQRLTKIRVGHSNRITFGACAISNTSGETEVDENSLIASN